MHVKDYSLYLNTHLLSLSRVAKPVVPTAANGFSLDTKSIEEIMVAFAKIIDLILALYVMRKCYMQWK